MFCRRNISDRHRRYEMISTEANIFAIEIEEYTLTNGYVLTIETNNEEVVTWCDQHCLIKVNIANANLVRYQTNHPLSLNEFANALIAMRKFEPAIRGVIDSVWPEFNCDAPPVILMDRLIELVDANLLVEAFKKAAEYVWFKGFQDYYSAFLRYAKSQYTDTANVELITASLTSIYRYLFRLQERNYMEYTDLHDEIYRFAMMLNPIKDETRMELLVIKFQATFCLKDPVASYYYRQLSGFDMSGKLKPIEKLLQKPVKQLVAKAASSRQKNVGLFEGVKTDDKQTEHRLPNLLS